MKTIKLSNSERVALVDDEDFDMVSRHNWYLGRSGYPETRFLKSEGGKLVRMHWMIMGKGEDMFTDHINMDGCDNRRENLRRVTKSQNMMNRGAPRTNTSGYKGVIWCNFTGKWLARIAANKKTVHLGRYPSKKEAARAYNEGAKIYHGEYARLNEI